MKIQYILPALLALGFVTTSIPAVADGLTYDPYGDYYSQYYGIGERSTASVESEAPAFYDPYANYYNTYYGIDGLTEKGKEKVKVVTAISVDDIKKVDSVENAEFADPSNYYNW